MASDAVRTAQLRIAIARFGEMDRRKWWNTKGLLSDVGELALSRGFSKTHVFARCRAAFAVAGVRSDEVFNPPASFTLWRLPVEIEDRIEDAWATWLEEPEPWKELVTRVDSHANSEPLIALQELGLVSAATCEKASKLRRADDLRSVPLKMAGESVEEAIELLAAAYSSSETGKLAVPFIREEEFPK
ncbi:BrxE family protein [Aeoliella sp.]|uniref:BrxE family protein n=1 Tax=Aeoliella sp. TaxID=2795800 RepID=UPI003CCBC9CB